MYACNRETGRRFFAGVCRREDRPLTFRDPPPRFVLKLRSHRKASQSPTETCSMTFDEKNAYF
jgi:hypothetical protein